MTYKDKASYGSSPPCINRRCALHALICVKSFILTCVMIHSYVYMHQRGIYVHVSIVGGCLQSPTLLSDSYTCMKSFILTRVMTHSCVWINCRCVFTSANTLALPCYSLPAMTHLFFWNNSFICVSASTLPSCCATVCLPWLIYMCDTTHPYVIHLCTWLQLNVHVYMREHSCAAVCLLWGGCD